MVITVLTVVSTQRHLQEVCRFARLNGQLQPVGPRSFTCSIMIGQWGSVEPIAPGPFRGRLDTCGCASPLALHNWRRSRGSSSSGAGTATAGGPTCSSWSWMQMAGRRHARAGRRWTHSPLSEATRTAGPIGTAEASAVTPTGKFRAFTSLAFLTAPGPSRRPRSSPLLGGSITSARGSPGASGGCS